MPEAPLLTGVDLLLLDLDGVVYVGPAAVPGAVDAIAAARAAGVAVLFATNNASRPPSAVAAHLERLGVSAATGEVLTSAQAGAALVAERLGAGARVLPVGGPGVRDAVVEAGLVPVEPADADRHAPAAVLQGFGPDLGWRDLADAAAAVRAGALWVATNTDLTLPTERGPAPGNGSLVGAVRNAVDVDPLVAGKPERTLFTQAAARAGASHPLVVGDRLDTDIAGARAAGMTSLLVLTGLTRPPAVLSAPAAQRPDHLGADLAALHAPGRPARSSGPGWQCGPWLAVADGGILRARRQSLNPQPGSDPGSDPSGDPVDLLRACAAAAWAAADAGAPVEPDAELAAALHDLDLLTAGRTG